MEEKKAIKSIDIKQIGEGFMSYKIYNRDHLDISDGLLSIKISTDTWKYYPLSSIQYFMIKES